MSGNRDFQKEFLFRLSPQVGVSIDNFHLGRPWIASCIGFQVFPRMAENISHEISVDILQLNAWRQVYRLDERER